MIKTYTGGHKCVRKVDHKQADCNWLASKLLDKLRENPSLTAKKLHPWVNDNLGVVVPYMRVYRALLKAMIILGGDPTEAFRISPKYREMLLRSNPGSIVEMFVKPVIDRPPMFQRFFCGLDGLRRGFLNGCSPFLFFDGCHLRGPYGGHLLSAVGTDADYGIYPVAWAIVESECKDSWGFFIQCLEQFIGPFDAEKHWHFMADRSKV